MGTLEKIKDKVSEAKDAASFAVGGLAHIEQTIGLASKIAEIQANAPPEIKIKELELTGDSELKNIYITLTCDDQETFDFLNQFCEFDKILPRMLNMMYERLKKGGIEGAMQAVEKGTVNG